jgi:hypothetical protein
MLRAAQQARALAREARPPSRHPAASRRQTRHTDARRTIQRQNWVRGREIELQAREYWTQRGDGASRSKVSNGRRRQDQLLDRHLVAALSVLLKEGGELAVAPFRERAVSITSSPTPTIFTTKLLDQETRRYSREIGEGVQGQIKTGVSPSDLPHVTINVRAWGNQSDILRLVFYGSAMAPERAFAFTAHIRLMSGKPPYKAPEGLQRSSRTVSPVTFGNTSLAVTSISSCVWRPRSVRKVTRFFRLTFMVASNSPFSSPVRSRRRSWQRSGWHSGRGRGSSLDLARPGS